MVPTRILDWILSREESQILFEAGHGTAPYFIYARGVIDTPSPDPTYFDRKQCTLIIVDIGLCSDLGCNIKFDKKTKKYSPSSRPSEGIGKV